MAHDCAGAHSTLTAQQVFFRLIASECGITQKMVAQSTRYCRTIVGEWARGETVMGLAAFRELSRMHEIPADKLSILLDGTERHVVDGEDDSELDTLGEDADAVASEVRRARHPASPGGVDIVPIEEARIRQLAVKLRRRAA